MKTTLIIGSGVSYYSKIPGISDITNSILTAENIGRGTDLNYYFEGYLDFKINHNLKDNDGHTANDEWKLLNNIKTFAETEKKRMIRKQKIKKIKKEK